MFSLSSFRSVRLSVPLIVNKIRNDDNHIYGDDDDTNNHIDKDGEDDIIIIIMRYCIRDCVYLSELVSPGKFGNFQGVPSETLRLLKDGVKGIPRAHLHLGYLTTLRTLNLGFYP